MKKKQPQKPPEERVHPSDEAAIIKLFKLEDGDTGVHVTPEKSFELSAYYNAVNIISSALACMPCTLYERKKDQIVELSDDELHYKLTVEPNPFMSAFTFDQTVQSHTLTWGNGYVEIERKQSGAVKDLWIIPPNKVELVFKDRGEFKGDLFYEIDIEGEEKRYIHHQNMLHSRALGSDGLMGMSIAELAKGTTELGLASGKYGRKFFGNSARPDGILTTDQILKDDTIKRMQKSWDERHQGLNRAHRLAILEAGVKYQTIGLPPEDAQFLLTQKFTVIEIARWFNLPPHMLKDLERATFSNIESQDDEFLKFTMLPWVNVHEQERTRKLVLPSKRMKQYFRYNMDTLARPGMLNRYKAYQIGILSGFISPDEARKDEHRNPIPDGKGSTFLTPANSQPLGGDPNAKVQ